MKVDCVWNAYLRQIKERGLGSILGFERDVEYYEIEMILIYHLVLYYYRIGCDVVFCGIKKEMMSQCIVAGNR